MRHLPNLVLLCLGLSLRCLSLELQAVQFFLDLHFLPAALRIGQ